MSKYINADELMKEFIEFVAPSNRDSSLPIPTWNDAVSLLSSAPDADVEKVVRCKDCKHSVQNKYATAPNYNYFCAKTSTATHIDYHSENWFCADGERRESEC